MHSPYPRRSSSLDHLPFVFFSWDFKLEFLITICSFFDHPTSLDKTQDPMYEFGPLTLQYIYIYIYVCMYVCMYTFMLSLFICCYTPIEPPHLPYHWPHHYYFLCLIYWQYKIYKYISFTNSSTLILVLINQWSKQKYCLYILNFVSFNFTYNFFYLSFLIILALFILILLL